MKHMNKALFFAGVAGVCLGAHAALSGQPKEAWLFFFAGFLNVYIGLQK
jgi:hypothetical protein